MLCKMADLRGKQLPNLKISVDNTESTDESDDEIVVLDDKEVIIDDVELEHSEESEDEEEIAKGDVEFNVRIGTFTDPKPKEQPGREGNVGEKRTAGITNDGKSDDGEKRLSQVQVPEKRVYENKQGSFVTGIDVISKEAQEKREERAKRFRIQQEASEHSLDVQALFASLGVSEEDWNNQAGGLRGEAVHLRGTDEMSTKDVFDYFTEFPASGVEWINDTSCNVVWLDKVTSIRAMLKLSTSRDDTEAAEMRKKEEREKDGKEGEKKRGEKKEKRGREAEKKKKELEKTHEEMEEEGAGDADKAKTPNSEASSKASQGDQGTMAAGEEAMEVEDDELDLMADDETEAVSRIDKTDSSSDKAHTASLTSDKTDNTSFSPDKAERTDLSSDKADTTNRSTEENLAAVEKACPERKKKTLVKKESAQNKEEEDSTKKKDRKEKKKKGGKEKEDGEESDSNSGSSSSSGSSSGSSSESSGSSSSGSDSSSSSSSDSDSGSGSDSESGAERKKKKKLSKAAKRDADTGEIARTDRQRSGRRKETGIVWPPGKWRLGVPCRKARCLFMRFATQDDKKELGAEKKSQYYRKYGNPNYGGMKGLISSSRKRQIRQAKLDKELKSQGPDAREMIDRKREGRQRQRIEEVEREDGELSNEDDDDMEESEGAESEGEVVVVEKPKDLRQLLNRDTSSPSRLNEESSLDKVVVKKRQRDEDDDEDEMDLDAELEQLLEPRPAKKRMMMRMRADEEEERIKAQRSRTGLLTVVASDRGPSVHSRLAGRLGGRLQTPLAQEPGLRRETRPGKEVEPRREAACVWSSEVRVLNSEDDDDEEVEEEEDAEEMDDFARELESYRTLRNLPPISKTKLSSRPKLTASKSSLAAKATLTAEPPSVASGGDLRSRLGAQKQTGASEKRKFPSMRIEVFDDDDE